VRAEIINKRFTEPTAIELVKEKQVKYLKPGNCKALVLAVPQINAEIRRKLSKELKTQDQNISYCQKDLIKAATAVAEATQEVNKLKALGKDEREPVIRKLTDALGLLGHSNFSLSMRRRDLIKPGLKRKYAALASDTVPLTSNLFGDDIEKTLKKIGRADDVGRDAAGYNRTDRYGSKNGGSYPRYNNRYNYRGGYNRSQQSHYRGRGGSYKPWKQWKKFPESGDKKQ
jgi:hypothetical protein